MTRDEGTTPPDRVPDTFCPPQPARPYNAHDGLLIAVLAGIGAAVAGAWHGWTHPNPISHVRGSDWDTQLTLLEATGRAWAAASLPVYNPWTAGGVPLLANPEAPVFHPIGWLSAALHPAAVARATLVSAVGLQVAGTLAVARLLGAPRRSWPVAVAALLTTDVLVWRMAAGHLMMAQAAWIPVAWAAVLTPRRWQHGAALGALCLAAAVHGGGHYPGWIGLASCAMWLVADPRPTPHRADALRRLAGLSVLTGLLTAPKWLVTAATLATTPRLRGPQAPLAMGDFTVLDATLNVFATAWSAASRLPGGHEALPTWGTPAILLLALPALSRAPARRAALAALLWAGVSLGHNLPINLFAWLHSVAPLDRFRNPERWALAWVPLLSALACVGVGRLATRWWHTALVYVLLAAHVVSALPLTAIHTGIDQVTADEYARLPATGPPTLGAPDPTTNLEAAGAHRVCITCADALLLEAPPGLTPSQDTLSQGVLTGWNSTELTFVVPADPDADPRTPQVSRVVVAQAARDGWQAEDNRGTPLEVLPHPAGTTVVVPTPDREVRLWYTPPGLATAGPLGWLGLLLTAVALWSGRASAPAHGDPTKAEPTDEDIPQKARATRPELRSTPETANPSGRSPSGQRAHPQH